MASKRGKARLGILLGRGVWDRGWVGGEGFYLSFFLEVSEYGIEDSVNRYGVIINKVIVYGRLHASN